MTNSRTRLNDLESRAAAIGQAPPFSAWQLPELSRLAAASSVSNHRSGTYLIVAGERCEAVILVVEGAVLSSVSSEAGRRVTINFDAESYAYGLAPLVDGLAQQHDLVADGHVTALRIPHAAIRAELSRKPALWESIAAEATRRGRAFMAQSHQFVFDAPLVRAAAVLLGLVAKSGKDTGDGPVAVDLRLPQERLAEMLGTSRQWVSALVRELSDAGLVEWRYGRVTVLNVKALRVLASSSVNVAGREGVRHGGRREVGRGAARATIN